MIKKLSHVRSAVQTYSVLSFFSLLFCLLAFAGMSFFSPSGALPYPADSSMVITKNKTSLDSSTFYNDLDKLANIEQVSIIKNVLNDDGKILGYVFGASKKMVGEPTRYTQNKNLLKTTTVAGNYYIIGKLSPNMMGRFRDMGLQFKVIKTPIWLVAASFLTGGDLYAVSFFTLLLMSFVVTYALLVMRLKEAVIERSFGIFQRQQARRFLGAMATILVNFIVFGTVIASMNHYFGTVQVIAFLLTLGLFLCLFSLIQVVAYTIFLWQVRAATISDIQKNKMSGKKVQVIWLFVLALSTILLTYETVIIVKNYPTYQSQKKLVKNWRLAGNYARVWWRFLENGNPTGNSVAQNDQIRRDNQNMRNFANSISNDEVLIAKLANEQASWTGKVDIYVAGKGIEMRSVNQTIAEKTYIINPKVLALNREIHPESQFKATSDKAVTVYIPEKYRKQIADIKLLAMRGVSNLLSEEEIDWQFVPNKQKVFLPVVTSKLINSGLKPTDFDVIIIPDDFKLFVSDVTQLRDSDQPLTRMTGQIIAQYDYDQMPDSAAVNRDVSVTILDTLYLAEKLPKAIKSAELSRDVVNISDTYQNLVNYQKQAEGDMVRSALVMVGLFVMQIFVIYEFLKLRLSLVVKKLCLLTLLGKTSAGLIMKTSLPLVIGIGVAFYKGASVRLVFWSLGVYIGLTLLLVFVAQEIMQHKRVTILKGESDLM